MDNDRLFALCLISSMIGIFCLAIFLENYELKETPISNITKDLIDQKVRVTGFITKITETKGLYLLNLKNDGQINVLIFKKENITLNKNSFVSIEGSVTEYENQTEIIAKRIIK